MADKRTMLLTADRLLAATYHGEVVIMLDLSTVGVFPEVEIGLRLLPAEARDFARQLEELAATAEIGAGRA